MMIPLPVYIGGGALLVGIFGGWTVRDWKADSDALEAKESAFEQYLAMTNALADQSLAYETLAQSLRSGERQDRETVREVYRNVQVPANCAVPPAGISVLDNAIKRANAATTGQHSGTVSDNP